MYHLILAMDMGKLMSKENVTGRRSFLIKSAQGAAALGVALPLVNAIARTRQLETIDLQAYKPEYFNTEEWTFLLAACDRLIPADEEGPGALQTNVPVFIDQQMLTRYGEGKDWYMDGPHDPKASKLFGYQLPYNLQQLYRRAIPIVNQYCQKTYGKEYHALDHGVQETVLHAIDGNHVDFASFGETAMQANHFFARLWEHTQEGYLADPKYGGNKDMQAWVMIGFPGARASYTEWVDQHNVKYPLGPVDLDGNRA